MKCTGLIAGFVVVVGISLAGAANAAVRGADAIAPLQTSVTDENLIVVAAAWDNRPRLGELLNRIQSKFKKPKRRGRFAEPSYGYPDDPIEKEIGDVVDPTEEVIDASVVLEVEIDDQTPDGSPTSAEDDLEECRLTQDVCAE